MTYDNPFLRSQWESRVVVAEWGPLKSTYDFKQAMVQDNFEVPKASK